MVKDLTGNKSKHGQDTDTEESRASTAEELSALFSTANFSLDYVNKHTVENEEDTELDIGKFHSLSPPLWIISSVTVFGLCGFYV